MDHQIRRARHHRESWIERGGEWILWEEEGECLECLKSLKSYRTKEDAELVAQEHEELL